MIKDKGTTPQEIAESHYECPYTDKEEGKKQLMQEIRSYTESVVGQILADIATTKQSDKEFYETSVRIHGESMGSKLYEGCLIRCKSIEAMIRRYYLVKKTNCYSPNTTPH